MSKERGPTLSVGEVVDEIRMMIQQYNQSGAGFMDPRTLEGIMKELLSGRMSPSEALEQARRISDGREDYH